MLGKQCKFPWHALVGSNLTVVFALSNIFFSHLGVWINQSIQLEDYTCIYTLSNCWMCKRRTDQMSAQLSRPDSIFSCLNTTYLPLPTPLLPNTHPCCTTIKSMETEIAEAIKIISCNKILPDQQPLMFTITQLHCPQHMYSEKAAVDKLNQYACFHITHILECIKS